MRIRRLLLLVAVALLPGSQCGIPVFLVDADVDDDGVVTAADLAFVESCLGADVRVPPPPTDFFGCPLRDVPPACAPADLDGSGLVSAVDLALVEQRLGLPVCNGSDRLCERRFDQVVYATTHNAMAATLPPYSYSILIANQCSGVPTQLADGIRALMLDVHWVQPAGAPAPDLVLGHSECDFGRQPLVEGLAEVREFLDASPGEVVAFLVETNAGTSGREAQIRDAFAASGLLPYAHAQAPGEPWPTLGEMIASGQRLVVLTDDSDNGGCGAADPCPWYQYLWSSLAFETPFSNPNPAAFTCEDLRGQPGNDLFILNHFLTQNTGSPFLARLVNFEPTFSRRVRDCWDFQRQVPNFVTVDYYELGDVLRVVGLFNYLWGQSGGASP
jgi:hypothetical protein